MAVVKVPIYGTRNLATVIDPGARTVLPGTNVTFSTDPVTGDITINSTGGGGGGSGTVTSVGLTAPTGFNVSGSPVTVSGTLALTYAAGYQGYTTAEAIKLAGIPPGGGGGGGGTGTVTSVAVANSTGITWTGSPITVSGTLTPTLSVNLQSWSGIAPASKQDALGFTPVQQGGGVAQGSNKVYIGWSGSDLLATVDATNMGAICFKGFVSANYLPLSGGTLAGSLTAGGLIYSTGAAAGLAFQDRTGVTPIGWTWYATGGIARLFADGIGDRVSVTSAGDLTVSGALQSVQNVGSVTGNLVLYAAGGGGIYLRPNGAASSVGQGLLSAAGDFYARDIYASRGDGTGVIYLHNSNTRYLYYDGTNYILPVSNLTVDGGITLGAGKKISKLTVSSAAPGALADGELYLRF